MLGARAKKKGRFYDPSPLSKVTKKTAASVTTDFIPRDRLYLSFSPSPRPLVNHSTVTLLARFRGLSTSVPRAQAV